MSLRLTRPAVFLLGMLLPLALLAADRDEVIIERSVSAKMRDGAALRADVYRPKAEGRYPVILQRTPYDKHGVEDSALRMAASGYVVIIQDVRGRYASDGEWHPFVRETQDGYDTVEWAASLPYSNGKVGMFGGSYVGATQMHAAIAAPPHLAGTMSDVTTSDYHKGWIYQGGALMQWIDQSWTSILAQDTLNRRVRQNAKVILYWYWKLPLASYPVLRANDADLAPYYQEWLAHPNYDEYWKGLSFEEQYDRILVPGYHFGGWYDVFLDGTLSNYMGIKARGGSTLARTKQRLIIGPWYHGPYDGRTGEVDFGPSSRSANGDAFDLDGLILAWYDLILKGQSNSLEREKPVKIFVMGENVWREEDDWPLARAQATRYYLHSGGKANSLLGDGTLSTAVAETELHDRFVYDPADPVPTRGGGLCCENELLLPGAFDQRPVEGRADVLIYTTPEFRRPFEVTGPVSLELYASSSAVDTDFTAKIVDVWPNGFAQNLTDSILRVRYRNSMTKPEFMNPEEIYKLTIDLVATSNLFKPGHKLRLEVSSSNFPRFDRNPNTGESSATSSRVVKATNTIYHDRAHPSALVLPVVPR
ncbi:MAG: CocE/NonD family hydrolase [Terriglobia bacterium]